MDRKAIRNLRKASQSLKQEIDDIFATTHVFLLDSMELYEQFLTSPTTLQLRDRCRLAVCIVILPVCKANAQISTIEDWYTVFGTWCEKLDLLPHSLRYLAIELRFLDCMGRTRWHWARHIGDLDMMLHTIRGHAQVSRTHVTLTYLKCKKHRPPKRDKKGFWDMFDGVRRLLVDTESLETRQASHRP